MPFTLTFLKSMTGDCTLTSITATVSTTRGSVYQDVDDQGHKEEHVDKTSLKPGKRMVH